MKINSAQQDPGGEPKTVDHDALLRQIRDELLTTAPTAENGVFFARRLAALLSLPTAEKRKDIQAAVHTAHQGFCDARIARNMEMMAAYESSIIDSGNDMQHQIGLIEAQLSRPDLTLSEQLALKSEHRRIRRELLTVMKFLNTVLGDKLERIDPQSTIQN